MVSSGPYSPAFLADLERTISAARLSRYMRAAGGDHPMALRLYEDNMAISEARFGVLHGLEGAVRNSIHYQLSADLGIVDWLVDGLALPWRTVPKLWFTNSMKGMINDARRN